MVPMASSGGGERSDHGSSTGGMNSLLLPEEPLLVLQQLLLEVSSSSLHQANDDIDFDAWKTLFVQRFEPLLEPQGVARARIECESIKETLNALAAVIQAVKLQQNETDQLQGGGGGGGHPDHLGGSGRGNEGETLEADDVREALLLLLNQVTQGVVEVTVQIREWMTAAKDDDNEEKVTNIRRLPRYNKYQFALVLVQDDFDVYVTMTLVRDLLKQQQQAFLEKEAAYCSEEVVQAATTENQDTAAPAAWQTVVARLELQIKHFADFVRQDLKLYEIMQKSTSRRMSSSSSSKNQETNGNVQRLVNSTDAMIGNDEPTEQGEKEPETQQQQQQQQQQPSSSSLLSIRRRRSLLGHFDKKQQQQQPPSRRGGAPRRRASLDMVADLQSLYDDSAAADAVIAKSLESNDSTAVEAETFSSSLSIFERRRQRSLVGSSNSDNKNQQQSQQQQQQPLQPTPRRYSLEISDLKSSDRVVDAGAASVSSSSFQDETVEDEKSFDTIEYFTDDDDDEEEEIMVAGDEKSVDTLEYYTDDEDEEEDDDHGDDDDDDDGSVGGAPFDEEEIVENEKSLNTLDYGEEAIENYDRSIDTLEYEEEVVVENLATIMECQEEEDMVDFEEEGVFGGAVDEKAVSKSVVDPDAFEVNEEEDESDGPLSLHPSYIGNQEDVSCVLADEGDKPVPPSLPSHLNTDPSPEQEEPPLAQIDPSVFATSGSCSGAADGDDDEANTRDVAIVDNELLFQLDPSVFATTKTGTTSSVSSEDDDDVEAREVKREESDPCLQFDLSDVSYERDNDDDIHEVIREESDPYLQFDPSEVACGSPGIIIVSTEQGMNNFDTQDLTCDDVGGKLSASSRGKRIRQMFGSVIRRPSKLHIDQSEDFVMSPSRTADENEEEQSCSNNLDADGRQTCPSDHDKDASSPGASQPPPSFLGLSKGALSPEQPLTRTTSKEQSIEQASQCVGTAPPSPSNRANWSSGIFKRLSSKTLSPRRESKSKCTDDIESPLLPHVSFIPDEPVFQGNAEAPPSPTNQANRFHEIFKGLLIHSPTQDEVDCSMPLIHQGESITSCFPSTPRSNLKSTENDDEPFKKQLMTGMQLKVEELQLQSPPSCNNVEAPVRNKKVSFLLPENHGKSASGCRWRRRSGSPRRRRTDNRPGTPRKRQSGAVLRRRVNDSVRDQDGNLTSTLPAVPLSTCEEMQLQSPALCDSLDTTNVKIKLPQTQRKPTSPVRRVSTPTRQRTTGIMPRNEESPLAVGKGSVSRNPIRWDLRVRFGSPARLVYNKALRHDNCVLVPDLFGPTSDWSIYHKLLVEMQQLQERNITGSNLIPCPQDVGTHLVCPNPIKSKTFKEVCKKVCTYFDIKLETIQFTLNWYRDNTDIQKPRHDEEAYENDKPSLRNITVCISFGAERELSLEKHEAMDPHNVGTRISIPQSNNGVCTIGRDVNIRFQNGLVPSKYSTGGGGTIGIIIWGQAQNVKEEGGSPSKLKREQ